VTTLLLAKIRDRPAWSPSTLEEVSDATIISNFFSKDSPYLSQAPKLTIPEHLLAAKDRNPMRYALPTEKEIGTMVRGSHQASGRAGLNLTELISKFEDLRRGKYGVKEKILEVAARKCDVVDNADGNFQWLKWKH
jgi:3-hydroxyisobutyryl-CoA hydrolase